MVLDDGTGTAPASGGGGSTADLELTIEDVEKIGQDTAALTTKTETARTQLADAKGSPGDFSRYPPAQALFSQHEAVIGVFEKTLASIAADIDGFGATIVQAARNHAQNDDEVLSTLMHIGTKVNVGGIKNDFAQARNEAGYDLFEPDDGLDSSAEITAYDQANPGVTSDSLGALQPDAVGEGVDGGLVIGGGDSYELGGSEPQ